MMKAKLLIIISTFFFSCNSDKSAKQIPDQAPLKSKEAIKPNKEIKENLPKDVPEQKFIGATLYDFYKDKEKLIKEVVWSSEPPGKLSSVIFILDSAKYYQVGLYDFPEKYRFNRNMEWKMSQVGSSKIEYITLMNGDTLIGEIHK